MRKNRLAATRAIAILPAVLLLILVSPSFTGRAYGGSDSPEAPQDAASFNPVDITPPWLNISVRSMCVDGTLCYVAGGPNGLHIFDISDPSNPVWVNKVVMPMEPGGETSPGEAIGVAVSGGYAYVAAGFSGLVIVDIYPPESASVVKIISAPVVAQGVDVSDGYAFVVSGVGGLHLIDVDPPESASVVKTVDMPAIAQSVAVSGEYAYVADGLGGLQIVDIDSPESASILTTVPTTGLAQGVDISGPYAYVADFDEGLQIVDIGAPESASIVKTVETLGDAVCVAVSGGYAYVANRELGLQVLDIDPPDSASVVKTVDMPSAVDVTIEGGYAYVADMAAGLNVVDIDPPESTSIVACVDKSWSVADVTVSEGYAYVADTESGLVILDLDAPESPSIVKIVDAAGAIGLAVSGGYAFVSVGGGPDPDVLTEFRLQIIDIDPPESASIVKTVEISGGSMGVAASGGYAYVAAAGSGEFGPEKPGESWLQIVDVDPPESASVIKSVAIPGFSSTLAVSGGYAYVGGMCWQEGAEFFGGGLQIIDIDPPESASVVNDIVWPEVTGDLVISDGYAYAACTVIGDLGWGPAGSLLHIVDIDPPESASTVNTLSPWGWSVALSDRYAYSDAPGDRAVRAVRIDLPESAVESPFTTDEMMTWQVLSSRLAVSGGYAYMWDDMNGLRIFRL